jgi:hypothetical protein
MDGSDSLNDTAPQYLERPLQIQGHEVGIFHSGAGPSHTGPESSFGNILPSYDIPGNGTGHRSSGFGHAQSNTTQPVNESSQGHSLAPSASGSFPFISTRVPAANVDVTLYRGSNLPQTSHPETLTVEEISRCFLPQNNLRRPAIMIAEQSWFKEHHGEPKISKDEAAARYGIEASEFTGSIFEILIRINGRKSFTCKWPDGNDECAKHFLSRSRARHHLYTHFRYRPFACGGKCGQEEW